MSTKANGVPCYDKAGPDEPIFVLRAQDRLAADVVRYWVELARKAGTGPATLSEASQCATEMDLWRTKKTPD